MKSFFLAISVLVAGCVSLPQNGALKCGPDPAHSCPSGFHCAGDGTCWRSGQGPGPTDMGTVHHDLASSDLSHSVLVTPPAAVWISSGGGSATTASGARLNSTSGGALVPGAAKATSGATITTGYFTSDTH